MPLMLQVLRDGEPRRFPNGIGGWHLGICLDAAAVEQARIDHVRLPDLGIPTLRECSREQINEFHRTARLGWRGVRNGYITVTRRLAFSDPSDGEVCEFLPGDQIHMWR